MIAHLRLAVALVLALSLAGVEGGVPPPDAVEIKGRVLLDANNSGKADDGDRGLADVLVSDGVRFVRTAADGSYTLQFADDPLIPYRPAQVVAVSWPSGTWPVQRQFFARRGDLEPGQSVDFLLREQKQSRPFTLAHGTDPHDNVCGGDGFRDDIARMADRVKFCLMTGDLGYASRDSAPKMFGSLRDATLKFPVPMLHAPGNHDVCDIHTDAWSEQHPLAGYGPWTRHLGPIRHSFTYADTHFVALDWARILPDGKLQTGVPDAAIAWLKKDLAELKPGTRTFLFMHHDFRHDDDTFWDVLVANKIELVLAGHSHRNKEETRRGVPRLTTQNLCGPYRLVTVLDRGHAVVNRCFTGTGRGHVHSYAGKCKMSEWKTLDLTRGKPKELSDRDLESAVLKVEGVESRNLEVVAEIEPGTSRRHGLRLLPADPKAAPFEVSLSGEELRCGDLTTAAVNARGQTTTHLRLVLRDGVVSVYANNRVQFERPYPFDGPSTVAAFAEGGTARCKKVEACELRKP